MKRADRRIAKTVIAELLKAGFSLSVFNGEDETEPSTDSSKILAAMMLTDEDYLNVHMSGRIAGWVRFIYGECGWDVINDYTVNLTKWIDEGPVSELVDRLQRSL